MKLRIKNLAKIKNATIDIKPLTIFIGPNGTGKTWAAYAFYSLIKQLRRSISLDTDIDLKKVTPRNFVKELETQARKITERIQEAKLGTSLEMKFDQNDIDLQVPKILKLSIKSEDMANLMLTNSQIFEKTQVDLELDQSDFKTNPKDALVIKTNDRYIETILGSESVIIPRSLQKEFSQTFFRSRLETVIFKLFVGRREQVIPFPSERKALLLLYKNISERQIRQIQRILSELQMDVRSSLLPLLLQKANFALPKPFTDFVHIVSEAEEIFLSKIKSPESPFEDIIHKLESEILNGKVQFQEDQVGNSRLAYSITENRALEIHTASSLTRALAGFSIYLRHIAKKDDCIIIDEPEMNAHPDAQLAIAELIALLVQKGVKVLLTTHSPYIVSHIYNLVEASRLDSIGKEKISSQLKLKSSEAFLPSDKVSIYQFDQDGNVQSILDSESINLKTFNQPSDYLNNIYSDILSYL